MASLVAESARSGLQAANKKQSRSSLHADLQAMQRKLSSVVQLVMQDNSSPAQGIILWEGFSKPAASSASLSCQHL